MPGGGRKWASVGTGAAYDLPIEGRVGNLEGWLACLCMAFALIMQDQPKRD